MRSVPPWVGKTDDTRVPPRVRARVFELYRGRCCCGCGWKIAGKAWDVDHIIAIANGGKNEEANLCVLLNAHHKAKTRRDVAIKAKNYSRRAKHIGVRKRGRSFATNKDQPFKMKMNRTIERRK